MIWLVLTAVVVGLVLVFAALVWRPHDPEHEVLEGLEQMRALRALRPGVCSDCGADLGLVSYRAGEGSRCGDCMLTSLDEPAEVAS